MNKNFLNRLFKVDILKKLNLFMQKNKQINKSVIKKFVEKLI